MRALNLLRRQLPTRLCPGGAEQQAQAVHHHDHRAAFVADHADGERNFAQQGEGDQHHHRPEGNDQVLADDAAGALAEAEGGQEILQPVVHEHDVRLFERGVRTARAHGDADVGGGQARGVVDAVAHHRHALALLGQRADGGELLLRLQLGAHVLDSQLRPQMLGGGLAVAGQHDGAQAFAVQFVHAARGLAGGCRRAG